MRQTTKQSSSNGQSNSLKIKLDQLITITALTPNQEKFFDIYKRGGYFTFLLGSPGVGKTMIAMYKAIEDVLDKGSTFKQLVVVRSTVATRDQGFLPGTAEEKSEIYELPYREIAHTLFNRSDAWDRLKEQGWVRFIPSSYIRGISIDDSIVLVDEVQNMTWGELSSIIGRVGHRSKIIFAGDKFQNDLTRQRNDVSGLGEFLKVAKTMKEFEAVYFTPDDIVRSSLVKSFIIACDKMGLLPGH